MSSPVMDLISTVPDDLPPRYGSDRSPTAIARVVSLIEGGRALNVSLYGGRPSTGQVSRPRTCCSTQTPAGRYTRSVRRPNPRTRFPSGKSWQLRRRACVKQR